MNKLSNSRVLSILSVLICVLIIEVVLVTKKINDKLNIINGTMLNITRSMEDLKKIKPVRYDFKGRVPETVRKYSSTDKYFYSWDRLPAVSETKDENGVNRVFRKELNDFSYHPVTIAQYGLLMFDAYVDTKDAGYLKEAQNQADYFVNSIDKKTGLLFYDFDFKVGGTKETLKTPWASAMAQGQACSLLIRLYYFTKDKKYYDTCKLAMKPFQIDVKDGGLKRGFFGYDYYEEYPTIGSNFTLNGFMFALIGLYDVWMVANDETAHKLYKNGFKALVYSLPFYDINGISLYHLGHLFNEGGSPHFNTGYHKVHIEQLRVINQWENNNVLDFYIKKWISYVNS